MRTASCICETARSKRTRRSSKLAGSGAVDRASSPARLRRCGRLLLLPNRHCGGAGISVEAHTGRLHPCGGPPLVQPPQATCRRRAGARRESPQLFQPPLPELRSPLRRPQGNGCCVVRGESIGIVLHGGTLANTSSGRAGLRQCKGAFPRCDDRGLGRRDPSNQRQRCAGRLGFSGQLAPGLRGFERRGRDLPVSRHYQWHRVVQAGGSGHEHGVLGRRSRRPVPSPDGLRGRPDDGGSPRVP